MLDLQKHGAAAVVLKSLFEEEILKEMNANLHRMSSDGFLYPETVDFYDFYETPEEATIKYLGQIQEAKKNLSIPVIASINCITASQWTYFPRQLETGWCRCPGTQYFCFAHGFQPQRRRK